MSFNYTRVCPEPVAYRTYGFQKISPDDMKDLVMRVQRPTHSSEIGGYFPDGYFKHPHRPTSGLCQKANPNATANLLLLSSSRQPRRPLPPKVLNGIVRRLQQPTLSHLAATGYIAPEYEVSPTSGSRRPKTAEERQKFLRRITRPTTASKRRDADTYWAETVTSEYYEKDFSNDQTAGNDEISEIVQRVRTATVASRKGEDGDRCPKRRPSVHVDRDKLPLVSGLARSRRVDEITERLYRPRSAATSDASYRY